MIKKDAIIIGSGQAANPLAQKLAKAGWKTILIEKTESMLGGTCLNVGCTPTKTMIASANALHSVKSGKQHGISVSDVTIDFSTAQKRKDEIVNKSRTGLKERTEETANLELIYGTASFTSDHSVVVKSDSRDNLEFTASHIFIDVGTRPSNPTIEGLESVKWYDSTGILSLTEIPEKLLVVGAGYIGLELGQMYSRFGSKVIIIEHSDQIMSREDSDIAIPLQEILEDDGLQFILNASIEKVENKGKSIQVSYQEDGKLQNISCTHLLLAVGRTSNADSLNVENAGIKLDEKGYVKVNSKLETNVKGIYALGDVNGGPQFTHIAHNDFVIVSKNILEKGNLSTIGRIVPYTMFTDPQLGRVGISEQEAKDKNLNFQVIKIPGKRITRGIETGEPQGPWKAIIDSDSGKILGAAIVCSEGGEIASVIQMAMEGNISAIDLSDGIFSHPTYSESLNTLFSQLKE